MEFLPYSCDNNGYKYVLILIYCFSKYGWSHPLKNKGAEEVREAMSNILQEGRSPKNLQTDAGKEFYNEKFKKLMRTYEINHFSTYSTKKASIVERVIRTIKNMLYKTFSLRGSYKWIDILSEITAKYNNTKHRTIKMKHADVTVKSKHLLSTVYNNIKVMGKHIFKVGDCVRISKHLLSTVYNNIKVMGKHIFKVGDCVRISKYRGTFAKGYTPNWSTELFKILQCK
ncbi:hypothetical protein QE152_g29696 [Popillia japonica]|uniref:Integrase catalytic domain-containing protein n=1 Tax=Popillia japonica TaxID=7064 RepID=A0AAW1JGS0_POPJA